MNMMQRGAAMVARTLGQHASHRVIYARNSLSISIDAVIGQTEVESQDTQGFIVRSVMRDFIMDTAPIDQHFARPQRGDIITDQSRRYEVVPVGDEPCYRWSDRDHTRYRIHTRLIG